MKGLLKDLARSSDDNQFKQTVTALHKQDIFTFIDFKCLKVYTRVLFLALLFGCLLLAECKTQTVNDKVRHRLDSMTNYTISYNGKNSEQQSSELNSLEKEESQLSRVDVVGPESRVTSPYTISDNGKQVRTLNGANVVGVTLANGEQKSSELNSLPRQESRSSRLTTARHESNSTTHNTTNDHATNPTTFTDSSFIHLTLIKLEQHTSGLDVLQKRNNNPAGIDIVQNLGTRMKSNQAGAGSNYPFAVSRQNSGNEHGYGPKKSDGDLKNCYGKLNKESLHRYWDKLRQYADKESTKKPVERTKTTSKDTQRSKTMRSLARTLQKLRESNCVEKLRQSMGGKPGQDRRRPDNSSGFLVPVQPSVTPTKLNNEQSRDDAKEQHGGGWTDFQLESLAAHNEYRARHGVPSLQLRRDLCVSSQKYANYLGSTDPQRRTEHSRIGENISVTGRDVPVTARSRVAAFYNEIHDYNFDTTYPIDESKQIGHFTAIVWKDTTHLGCGIATSLISGVVYIVCHYDPPGNGRYRSDPAYEYLRNVLPPLYR